MLKIVFENKFLKQYAKLEKEQMDKFQKSLPLIKRALEGDTELYKQFRIKKMNPKKDGIWEGHIEINLVFTLDFTYNEKDKICNFRRIGTHSIYSNS